MVFWLDLHFSFDQWLAQCKTQTNLCSNQLIFWEGSVEPQIVKLLNKIMQYELK